MNRLAIRYFPALVVIDREGNIVSRDGVTEVEDYGEDVGHLWMERLK